MAQIEKVEEILEGLESEGCFEHAHKLLGEMVGPILGGSSETCASCLKTTQVQKNSSSIDVKKARQVSSHPGWMLANVPASKQAKILPCSSPQLRRVHAKALAHPGGVALRRWRN